MHSTVQDMHCGTALYNCALPICVRCSLLCTGVLFTVHCLLFAVSSIYFVACSVIGEICSCAVLISNAVAAFWVSALGSGDHCLGRFVLPPNSRQLDKCQSSISVFVYFVFLLPVQQFSLPRPTAPNKRVNVCFYIFKFMIPTQIGTFVIIHA